MNYKRIILEGKSYLMLEENLGLLKYKPFIVGEINTKYYSDNEALNVAGIAPIETVTRKTVDGKRVEEIDSKFALKFKWNVNDLKNDSALFTRYYNYFSELDNGKGMTVAEFMPFVNSKEFKELLNFNDIAKGDDESEDDSMFEAKVDPINNEMDSLSGFSDPDELSTDDAESFDSEIKGDDLNEKSYLYLIFKYKQEYNHGEISHKGAFHDGSKIEILKLVSENGATVDAKSAAAKTGKVGITGRMLEKVAPGFYSELIGILNMNHINIVRVAADVAREESGIDIPETVSPMDNGLDAGIGDSELVDDLVDEPDLQMPSNGGVYDEPSSDANVETNDELGLTDDTLRSGVVNNVDAGQFAQNPTKGFRGGKDVDVFAEAFDPSEMNASKARFDASAGVIQ